MKKSFLLIAALFAAAILVASGGTAFALTGAHVATATGATQGDCSICHIPHKAQGAQRLFPNEPTAGSIATYGYMGTMCAEYCHNQQVNLPRAYAANTALINVGSTTLSNAAHGLNLSGVAMPPDTVVAATLPYGNGARGKDSRGVTGNFECTTCHDPHKNATGDTSQALLRMDIDAICDECHTMRGAGNAAWSGYGDLNNVGGAGTASSHPVGTNVTGDSDTPANSHIFFGMAAASGGTSFDVAYGGEGNHNLGGHLINGGAKAANTGMTCVTCHAVHGNQNDPGASLPAAPTGPFEDLLVIQQGVQGATEPARSANGNGDASDALCAGCHAYTTAAADDWNPGASAYGHPCNAQQAQANMGTIAAPAGGWPFGNNAVAGRMDLGMICESCHKPHAATVNSHILRADEQALCQLCHTGAPAGHHPSGVPMGAMADAAIDLGVSGTLECADCHSGNGAHNWPAAGAVGLSPAWEPYQNGRWSESANAPGVNSFIVNTSKECIDCHTAGGTRNSPTLHNDNSASTLTNRGNGSHYIGTAANSGNGALQNGVISGAGFNSFTTAWPSPGNGAWSRFGGADATNYQMVCESCHELEFDKNSSAALLVYPYIEREDFAQSRLCTGCHGEVPGGSSVHPLTGGTISAAVDAGRGTITLVNDPANGYANAAGSPNTAEYPGGVTTNNRMNCDSCHQPHDTVTAGGTFILEGNATASGGSGLTNVTVEGVVLTGFRANAGQGINHAVLCTQCHNY